MSTLQFVPIRKHIKKNSLGGYNLKKKKKNGKLQVHFFVYFFMVLKKYKKKINFFLEKCNKLQQQNPRKAK